MSVNKVLILGKAGGDPELKYTPKGDAVCTVSIATGEAWTDKSGKKQERTEWHRVVTWGKPAERMSNWVRKGDDVYIEGKIRTRSWEDNVGEKKYSTEINTTWFEVFPKGDKPNQKSNTNEKPKENILDNLKMPEVHESFTHDDIPF